jgi:hypothetical protein
VLCSAFASTEADNNIIPASLVAPSTPTTELGYAWGYNVRQASSVSNVLLESPFEGGYDLTIGTSERGQDVTEATASFGNFK